MPGIMWYFVIALIILIGLMLAIPSEGAVVTPHLAAAVINTMESAF